MGFELYNGFELLAVYKSGDAGIDVRGRPLRRLLAIARLTITGITGRTIRFTSIAGCALIQIASLTTCICLACIAL